MAEIEQYTFTHQEVIETLIKKAGVHDGRWSLSIQFVFAAGNFGQTPGETYPGVMALVQKLGIQRTEGPVAPGSVIVDAAQVNPRKSGG